MAKSPRLDHEQAVAWIESVRADLARLPSAVQRWTDPARPALDRERSEQATVYGWRATGERFELLAIAFLTGRLPVELAPPFAEIADKLRCLMPTLKRLGLQCPPAALLEQLAARLERSPA